MENHFRGPWTHLEDEILLELVSDGMRFRKIAERIGRTRNACIGRMHRLAQRLDNPE